MECAVCYEKFFRPKSKKEFKKMYNENVKNNDFVEMMKFTNLLITPKHNNTHTCSTPNCSCLICGDCWIKIKITCDGKDINEIEWDNIPSVYDFFCCPYCRQIDWKEYMNNVFNELQIKVLGQEDSTYAIFKRLYKNDL